MTVEDLLKSSPEMPRAVAEYHVAQFKRHSDPAERLRSDLPTVPSVAALRAMSPAETFAAWLDGRSLRRQIERLAARGQIPPETAAASLSLPGPEHQYVAIGAVNDGERLAHVLYRIRMNEAAAFQGEMAARLASLPEDEQALTRDIAFRGFPQVATCRRQPDGTWALLADHGFLGVGSTFITNMEAERREPEPEFGGEDC
jgi:hypothetical protein